MCFLSEPEHLRSDKHLYVAVVTDDDDDDGQQKVHDDLTLAHVSFHRIYWAELVCNLQQRCFYRLSLLFNLIWGLFGV